MPIRAAIGLIRNRPTVRPSQYPLTAYPAGPRQPSALHEVAEAPVADADLEADVDGEQDRAEQHPALPQGGAEQAARPRGRHLKELGGRRRQFCR